MDKFSQLAQNPDFTDDTWKIRVATQLGIWKATYTEAQQLTVPPKFADVHQSYLAGLSKFNDAADHVAQGLDNGDPSLINTAGQEMTDGSRSIQDASAKIKALE